MTLFLTDLIKDFESDAGIGIFISRELFNEGITHSTGKKLAGNIA